METWTYLMQGDCLERMKEIPDGYVDLVLCDLPYGTTQNKWDAVIPLDKLWDQYTRLCKGALILFCAQLFTSALVMSKPKLFKYDWKWAKGKATGHLNAKKMPMRQHEDILVFGDAITYNPQDLKPYGKMTRRGNNGNNFGKSGTENFQEFTNYPRSILNFDNDPKPVHPTQKPVALLEYLIRTYTNDGATVLDNTMGSGSTGVACVNAGRNFIGIERDENYFAIAQKRVADAKTALPKLGEPAALEEVGVA